MKLSFAEDIEILSKLGIEGIGIDARKLGKSDSELEQFRASGLKATVCFPVTASVLPSPHIPGPDNPAARVDELCKGLRLLARFEPAVCVCATGPRGKYETWEARALVVDGVRRVARAAAELGLTLAVEPMHASLRDDWTIITSLPEAAELIEAVAEPNVGILLDIWHVWDTPDVIEHARHLAKRVVAVHMDDWRLETRGWCDRVLPGDGIADLPGILGALAEGGFDGWCDLEILSDDGTFGSAYDDSLWKQDPAELISRGRMQFEVAWRDRRPPAGSA